MTAAPGPNLSDATVAWTAYNLLALAGTPATLASITTSVQSVHSAEGVEDRQVEAALAGLLSRGWINFDDVAATYSLRDSERRFAKWRDRSGDGWTDWKVDGGPGVGPIPIERVVS